MTRVGIALTSVLVLCASAQDEMEPNPEYRAWAKQKPGAWVKWTVQTAGAMKLSSELTVTLKELSADKAVLVEETVLKVGGEPKPHTGSRVLSAKIRKGTTADGDKFVVQKEGDEVITLKNREIQCHWVELKLTERQGRTIKIWRTDEVVGGVAKMVTKHDEAAKMTLTMTVVDWKPAE
jgi:hypothetical protein